MPNPSGSADSFASLFEQSPGATRGRARRFHTGESVEVTVVAIAREAVFVDLGGKQEGVFERIDLADADGKLRVELGSRISAVVGNVDFATGQVKLRPVVIRNTEGADVSVPAATSSASSPLLVEGARIKGRVTGVERYGVFVQISGTQGRSGRGLVPTQETATPRGADLKKHFSIGQDVEAKILAVDETGKIRLSISALSADDERGHFEAFKSKDGTPTAEGGAPAKKEKAQPVVRGFGTLGDMLGKVVVAPKPAAPAAKAAPGRKETPASKAPADAQKRAPVAMGETPKPPARPAASAPRGKR